MRVLIFLEEGAPKRSGKGKPSPQELAAIKTHTERVNAFVSHLTKPQKAWVTKWRKKFKPREESRENNNPERVSRSRSVAGLPGFLGAGFLDVTGLSDLFEERKSNGEHKSSSNNAVALVEEEKIDDSEKLISGSLKPKRRQTVAGKKTAFFDL